MQRLPRSLVLVAAVLATGVLRVPLESALTANLRTANLLLKPLDVTTQAKLGQTSAAVALGGLRTVVAVFQNIRANTAFQQQDWPRVASAFETVTTLAPRTVYYWQTGGWHMATNAASAYRDDQTLPPPRRAELRRAFILQGTGFLERGVHNNPTSWELPYQLALLSDDPAKIPNIDTAVRWMDLAVSLGDVPPAVVRQRLYLLARHPRRRADALALARELYAQPSGIHRVSTLVSFLYALEHHPDVPPAERHSLAQLHPSPQRAYQSLCSYWQRRHDGAPMDGVRDALVELEKSLLIPAQQSIFHQPDLTNPAPPGS
jgi:hypothetical protein